MPNPLLQLLRPAFLLLLLCAETHAQRVLRVPQDRPTIQAAIDVAAPGDTVLVAPGTYHESLNFEGKPITVTTGATSAQDPAVSATVLTQTLNQLGYDPIAVFHQGEDARSVLNGFTITVSGPVFNSFSSSTGSGFVMNAVVDGSGIQNTYTSVEQTHNVAGSATISNNRFIMGASTPTTLRLSVLDLPGGLISGNSFRTLTVDTILDIGLGISPETAEVRDNVFIGNTVSSSLIMASSALLHNNIVQGNTVGTAGAISLLEPAVFVQNLVTGNQANLVVSLLPGGGGLLFINNTLAANTPVVACQNGSCNAHQIVITKATAFAGNDFTIANNIIQSSTPETLIACTDGTGGPFSPQLQDTLGLDHNLFETPGTVLDPSCRTPVVNAGNLMQDPVFVDPATGNWHLASNSPAVDAGNNSVFAALSTFRLAPLQFQLQADLDGVPRPLDSTGRSFPNLDIGVYEQPGAADGSPTSLLLTPSSYLPEVNSHVTITAQLSSALGIPAGVVTLFEDGAAVASATASASGTVIFPASFPSPGVHEFVATYPGHGNVTPATSLKLELDGRLIPTFLNLSATPANAVLGSSVTLTVATSSDDGSIPSPIRLLLDGQPLGTVIPDANGVASLVVKNPTVGTHTAVAAFAGTPLYGASTASASFSVTDKDFSVSLSPPSLHLSSNTPSGSSTITIASLNGFEGALQLSLGSTPAKGTFRLSNNSVTLSPGAPATATLLVSTFSVPPVRASSSDWARRAPVVLAAGLLLLLPFRRKVLPVRFLVVLLVSVSSLTLSGCSDLFVAVDPLPPGTYQIPVIVSDSSGLVHSATLTLQVGS